jgi:protein disulfide isomerase
MSRRSLLRLVSFACLSLACLLSSPGVRAADPSGAAAPSEVIVLTDANFDQLTSSGSWLLEFYAPWCGHCKTLAPVYEDAARKLRGQLQLAKIDATVQTALAAKYEVKGFPTLKLYREGEIRNYNGPRTVDGIVAFGKEMNSPAVTSLTKASEYNELASKHPVSLVFFGGKGGVERRLFDALAFRLQGLVKFFAVEKSATEIYDAAKVKQDEVPLLLLVTAHSDPTESSNRYAGPWVDVSLREFVLTNKLPLISVLGQDNFEEVTQSGKKIVYIVVNSKDTKGSQRYIDTLYSLAKIPAFREAFVFASLDGIKYNKYVSQFGVTVGDAGSDVSALPTVVVLDKELDYFYSPRPQGPEGRQKSHPIGEAAIVEQFLHDVIEGRIALTGTVPWYNPSRYVKALEKTLSKLPVWQVAVLAVFVVLTIVGAMFMLCFYGMDSGLDEEELKRESEALKKATAEGKYSGKKKDAPSTTSAAAAASTEEDQSAEADGLKKRKGH